MFVSFHLPESFPTASLVLWLPLKHCDLGKFDSPSLSRLVRTSGIARCKPTAEVSISTTRKRRDKDSRSLVIMIIIACLSNFVYLQPSASWCESMLWRVTSCRSRCFETAVCSCIFYSGMACDKKTRNCGACGRTIIERFLLHALDQYWHMDCLKCSCCDVRLGEVGSSCFSKGGMILCRNDYLR